MTEAVAGPSSAQQIKQESESFGFFDSLDILATIATQELKSKNEEKVSWSTFCVWVNCCPSGTEPRQCGHGV